MKRGRSGDHLDTVGEIHTYDQLWQLVAHLGNANFLRGLDELENYRERGLVRYSRGSGGWISTALFQNTNRTPKFSLP